MISGMWNRLISKKMFDALRLSVTTSFDFQLTLRKARPDTRKRATRVGHGVDATLWI